MLRIMLELRWTHVRKRHFPCRHYMEKREDPGDEVAATVSARSQRVANHIFFFIIKHDERVKNGF